MQVTALATCDPLAILKTIRALSAASGVRILRPALNHDRQHTDLTRCYAVRSHIRP
jgi:hypothetical protein